MYSIMTLHLCIRNITKENQEQSKTSFATRFYLFYIWGVYYKGLNGSLTFTIYHMTRHIECIHKQTISKHHAYIMLTT
jgi:hypothetical protein